MLNSSRLIADKMTDVWECAECAQENEAGDEACLACEEPRPQNDSGHGGDDKYAGYKVAEILAVEDVAGKAKLRVVQLDIGNGAEKAIKVHSVTHILAGTFCN